MRLMIQEQTSIMDCFKQTFEPSDHLWIFRSRMDDHKRGGDIDLYIETQLSAEGAVKAKFKFLRLIQNEIGEQKIDIVLNVLELNQHLPIYETAKKGHLFV